MLNMKLAVQWPQFYSSGRSWPVCACCPEYCIAVVFESQALEKNPQGFSYAVWAQNTVPSDVNSCSCLSEQKEIVLE